MKKKSTRRSLSTPIVPKLKTGTLLPYIIRQKNQKSKSSPLLKEIENTAKRFNQSHKEIDLTKTDEDLLSRKSTLPTITVIEEDDPPNVESPKTPITSSTPIVSTPLYLSPVPMDSDRSSTRKRPLNKDWSSPLLFQPPAKRRRKNELKIKDDPLSKNIVFPLLPGEDSQNNEWDLLDLSQKNLMDNKLAKKIFESPYSSQESQDSQSSQNSQQDLIGPMKYSRSLVSRFSFISVIDEDEQFKLVKVQDKKTKEFNLLQICKCCRNERFNCKVILDYPFILKINAIVYDDYKNYSYISYSNVEDVTTLSKKINLKQIKQENIQCLAAKLLLALEYIHKNEKIYRDLCPKKVLLYGENSLMLIPPTDIAHDNRKDSVSMVGTFPFLAPEILKAEESGEQADWWSFGAIIYKLMYGKAPFESSSFSQMVEDIIDKDIVWIKEPDGDTKDFFCKIFSKNPTDRPLPKELKIHPFFREIEWETLVTEALKQNHVTSEENIFNVK